MDKRFSLSILLLVLSIFFLKAQTTAIPDAIFENYLETHSADGVEVAVGDANSMGDGIVNNGLVLTNNINSVVLLDVSGLGIADLSGIEDFTALENLFCNANSLSSLDISNNANLVSLICGSNNLTALDVSLNFNLETLNCSNNQILSLDVSNNNSLKNLTASGNQIPVLDISNNTELSLLNISNNRIEGELVVSNNPNLQSLYCASNQITTLDLSTNTLIKNLDASDNLLTSLDLGNINTLICPDPQTDPETVCQATSSINVSNNQLNTLIVANGYNELISIFNATGNSDLYCIQIDVGFTPSSWMKDDWIYYSDTTCVDIYTYVPDDNFEQALINLGYDNVLDNLVLTTAIETVTNLNISNASITDLTGIEGFMVLEILDCSNNTIQGLELSNNTMLIQLDVSNNDLSVIDVSGNPNLTTLNCSSNFLQDIDVSSNFILSSLNCSSNSLTQLDISANTILTHLDCSFNQIESLDITSNTLLNQVFCNDNNLFALNLSNGNNTVMTTCNASNNPNLFCIQVDDVVFANGAAGWQKDVVATYNMSCGTYVPDNNFEQALIDLGIDSDNTLNNFVPTTDVSTIVTLDISGLVISDLTGVQDFIALETLNCSNNSLLELDLVNNLALTNLNCSFNQIQHLDFTLNSALTSLLCNDNMLLTLNIENGLNTALGNFNATNNPNLYCINVDDSILGNIPGSWQKDDIASYDSDCINNRYTLIPDNLFEQALIGLGYDDAMDGQVLTSNIEHMVSLDISDESISDLSGIEDFKSLEELDCSSNYLDELDVSQLIYLERLNCSSNYLLTNDINNTNGLLNTNGAISLTHLYCANNNLGNLDTSLNTNLQLLDCSDNNLAVLNIDNNTLLQSLNCSNNNLSNLDISTNSVLESVNCNSNQINVLSTTSSNDTTLIDLSCVNNNLLSLDVTNYQSLTMLNCDSNDLTDLNLDSNTDLVNLSVSSNDISTLNLSNNINLVEVNASQNSLSQLDLASNLLLEKLNCSFNQLTDLDVSNNLNLELLVCSNNQLTALNLSTNTSLVEVNCSSNQIANLSLSNDLGVLKRLNISSNLVDNEIDLSTMAVSACVFQVNQTDFCPETIVINVSNNLLEFVNIQNGINSEIVNLNTTGNPNLSCIQVDDSNMIGTGWIKDDTTEYSEDCNYGETYVPDDNFEQALIDLGYDSGPLNDYVPTINIETVTTLDVNSNSISDLTGIEDFEALEVLNCSNNAILQLDLSSNFNLTEINCSGNLLSTLNIANNSDLEILNCSDNAISTIDFSFNHNLVELNISNNNFTDFSASEIVVLEVFNCDNNQITNLDFQQNQVLTSLSCQSNLLETLNVRNGQNNILLNLNTQNNSNLFCIETDNGSIPTGATWLYDSTMQLAINCYIGQTYVPDDNFEQALIDLGYDSAPLDDYVVTENIENINYLNINSSDIADLTGIEAFVNLTTLIFNNNNVVDVDLSNNTLLVNLTASNNLLTVLDISDLTNLSSLDISNNSITMLNFDSNLGIMDLDVSNNELTVLSIEALVNLEDLNCASNQLSSLDTTQNSNLNSLYCQSNMFVGDQLNIQNGNNENLQIFNATNNPSLGCILVDDPVAVLTNADGSYDNWIKDDSATYQIICDDADNDGVPNEDDLCPNTELGALVDLFGCAQANLPNDNFSVLITGETCLNSNNGKITIVAQELYNYTVTLENEDFYQDYNFTNDIDILNLLAGTYQMCITIQEWPDYISCYTVVITQPNPLEVFDSRPASSNDLKLNMSGSSSFNIEFNDEVFTTYNPEIILELQQGVNHVRVTTDLECQGIFEKTIFVSDDFEVYPNPFKDELKIFNVVENEKIMLKIYSMVGQLVYEKMFNGDQSQIHLNTSTLKSGLYIISIESESLILTFKIIKE